MLFQEFFDKYNNTYCDFDGAYGAQCFDLVNFWSVALGNPPFTGDYAYQIFDQAGTAYTQIPNTPEAIPQRGDVVVWSGVYNGGPGHTGIATGVGDTSTFECFEQNDPLGANCHVKVYNYTDVLGWLRPKTTEPTVSVPSATFSQLVDKSTKYDGFYAAGYTTIDDVNAKITDLQKQLSDCQSKVVIATPNPVENTSTQTVEVPISATIPTTSAPQANPLPTPTPIKPPMDFKSTIVFVLTNIYNALKKWMV